MGPVKLIGRRFAKSSEVISGSCCWLFGVRAGVGVGFATTTIAFCGGFFDPPLKNR